MENCTAAAGAAAGEEEGLPQFAGVYFHTPAPSRVGSMENDGESCRKTSSKSFHTPAPSPSSRGVDYEI